MSKVACENLEVYQLSFELAKVVYAAAREWRILDRDTVGKQLIRAADSSGANIAEGFGRGNGADQKRFLRIARGSVYETKHWLWLAYTRSLLSAETVDSIKLLLDKLPHKLNAYMKAVSRVRVASYDNPQSTIHSPQSNG